MDDREHSTEHSTDDDRPLGDGVPDHGSVALEATRLLLPLLIIGIGVGAFFALASFRKEPEKKPVEEKIPVVTTTPVEVQRDGLTIDGVAEALQLRGQPRPRRLLASGRGIDVDELPRERDGG